MEIGVELRSDFLLLNLSICLSTIPQTICFPPKTTHAPTVDPTMTYTKETTGAEVASNLSPHIRNKTVLVTGVSPKGLGAEFLSTIAAHAPGLLILAGRTTSKCRQTAQALASVRPSVKTRVLELDLASQKSVRGAADEVNGWTDVPAIDVLVLNAGIMAAPYSLTEDGLESQFGGNHVGHFLLANLIMGKVLKAQEGGRVVSVSSDGFRLGPIRFDDLGFDGGKTYNPWAAYGQSKTANALFAVSLAERLGSKGLVAVSVHPGVISTNLSADLDFVEDFKVMNALDKQLGNATGWLDWSTLRYKTLQQGVATHVRAAFEPRLNEYNGRYLQDAEVVPEDRVRAWARDKVEAEKLWRISEELVGQKFSY
ncbi:MAG: hypothetical protein LQ340_001973 [Diploschistes diacapsis]|nr:MAG: hypothetical protein LQ340_001973 [Diploschistes diacapsis]